MLRRALPRTLATCALAACGAPADDLSTVEESAVACAHGPTIAGMDVSYYEESVDWVAAHKAGIEFAFIRASDGLQFPDPKFATYWDGAKAAGVIRGAYQFFRPAQDPIAQADLLLEATGPYQAGDLPPVLDVETSGNLTPAQVAAAVHAWVDHVTAAIGRPPIIYAGLYSWHDLTGSEDLTTSPLWVAQYTSAACPNIPTPWTSWLFWQYTATGSVDGIPGMTLDMNVFDGTREDLLAFTGAGPCGTLGPAGGTIDDGDACFSSGGPLDFLRHVTDSGEGGDLIWTHATASASEANYAQWDLVLAESGRYRVEVSTPASYATSTRASYTVTAAGTPTTVTVDQSAVDGWQSLGEFDFAAGGAQSIHLGDNTGEASASNAQLVFDAIRLTRIDTNTGSGSGSDEPPPTGDSGGCDTTGSASLFTAVALATLVRRRRRAL